MPQEIRVFTIGATKIPALAPGKISELLGIVHVDDIDQADVIAAGDIKAFRARTVRPGKVHLLWTHETGRDRNPAIIRAPFFPEILGGAPLYVFNAHNGLVYTDNFYFGPRGREMPLIESEADLNAPFGDKTVSMAASYFAGERKKLKRLVLLYPRRQEIALDLHAAGRVRIIGRHWPEGVTEGESRNTDRARAKRSFLEQTNFNLCYENSLAEHYVTEKIWEAIQVGCLPIYHPPQTLYQVFPRDSFIDGSAFKTTDDLIAFMDAMSFDDYKRRVNLCRGVVNQAIREDNFIASRERTRERLRVFLHQAVRMSPGSDADDGSDAEAGAPETASDGPESSIGQGLRRFVQGVVPAMVGGRR